MLALVSIAGCGSESDGGGEQPAAGTSGGSQATGGSSGASGAGAGGAGAGGESGMAAVSGGAGGVAGGATGGAGGEIVTTGGVGGGTGGTGGAAGGEDYPDPRNGCPELDTGFPGDEACIAPPPEGEGFQIHIGPPSYDNPGIWVVQPEEENSWCANFHLPNTEEVFYQGYVLSGRPGTHHIINTAFVESTVLVDGELGQICLDGGTGSTPGIYDNLPGASKAYMPRKKSAPENAGIGRALAAGLPAQADMHYFNFTEEPLLREFWLNLYYIPKEMVTERAQQIRGMGGIDWSFLNPIQPGTNKVYQYTCAVPAAGRIVSLLGHYHAHGVRFTAYHKKAAGGQTKVFEMYDYNEPAEFSYDSLNMNPAFSSSAAGAVSGTLEVAAGDELQWECHIINNDDFALDYSNKVKNGEMCNLWGASVLTGDPKINCVHIAGEVPFTVEAP